MYFEQMCGKRVDDAGFPTLACVACIPLDSKLSITKHIARHEDEWMHVCMCTVDKCFGAVA